MGGEVVEVYGIFFMSYVFDFFCFWYDRFLI